MPCRRLLAAALLAGAFLHLPILAAVSDPLYREATVETSRTSIYVGRVTLELEPFQRVGGTYQSTYAARVFPYFFYNEHGSITITLGDEDLRRILAGETVEFVGDAMESSGDPRKVTGRITPKNSRSGDIKVRVSVSPRIELIFNSSYRFTGDS